MNNASTRTPTLRRNQEPPSHDSSPTPAPTKQWWAPLWRGLLVDPTAKHHRAMRSALWFFAYLIVHANRSTGVLKRKLSTIASDMGISRATVQYGMTKLRRGGYITTRNSGRFLEITIAKWKPIGRGIHKK